MENLVFVVNNRFVVNNDRSEILDKSTGLKTRLEPRLMKLLCLLAGQNGAVVKRELIIKEIWDDYPGANEGLNQAISFLRKLLNDDDKLIIQTQPKSGYSFHASISKENAYNPALRNRYMQIVVGAAFLLLLLFVIFNAFLRKNAGPLNGQANGKTDAEISSQDSIHQAKQMEQFSKNTLRNAARGDSLGKAAKGDSSIVR
jgi:DNA-binding winged helix-turn-helix (wHTH) protein